MILYMCGDCGRSVDPSEKCRWCEKEAKRQLAARAKLLKREKKLAKGLDS